MVASLTFVCKNGLRLNVMGVHRKKLFGLQFLFHKCFEECISFNGKGLYTLRKELAIISHYLPFHNP